MRQTRESVHSRRDRWTIFLRACRGGMPRICKVFTLLLLPGITGQDKRRGIRSGTEAAEKATRCLWIKKADP